MNRLFDVRSVYTQYFEKSEVIIAFAVIMTAMNTTVKAIASEPYLNFLFLKNDVFLFSIVFPSLCPTAALKYTHGQEDEKDGY